MTTSPSFDFHDIVVHHRSGRRYRIVMLPDQCFIEHLEQPAYAYQDAEDYGSRVWVRPKAEMEDGRFYSEREQPGPSVA